MWKTRCARPLCECWSRQLEGREARSKAGKRRIHHPLLLTDQILGTLQAAITALQQVEDGADLPQPRNRGTKPAAKDITAICARAFESMTGKPATFSSEHSTGIVSGDWPSFLTQVFDAMHVRASVAAQVRDFSKKKASTSP
jgi:hypothetical protein